MTQDRNYTFTIALKAVLVATLMLLGVNNIMAQVTVKGSVFGGGNEADVLTNTVVNISAGTVEKNVYGGGNLGDVGTIDKTDQTTYNYIWTSNTDNDPDNDTGICTVEITGGTIGAENKSTANHASGHVFGAGKGSGDNTYWCEQGMVYKTSVSISKGTVYGNVYGGGEVGRVENNTTVTIGPDSGTDAPEIKGNVFGAGAGLETHGYSALVRNNSNVTVQGYAKVRENVYGGGEVATVGRYWVNIDPLPTGAPPVPDGVLPGLPYQQRSGGICTVIVQGHAIIGPENGSATETVGHVFGAGKGATPNYNSTGTGKSQKMTQSGVLADFAGGNGKTPEEEYKEFLETLALATHTSVTIGDANDANGDIKVKGSVYGGSENGFVQHNTSVIIEKGSKIGETNSYGNIYGGGKGYAGFAAAGRVSGSAKIAINDGIMYGSVYGGGELGIIKGGVNVNMTGGTITKDVYGGGALADTNTENWNGTTLVSPYHEETGLTVGTSVVTGLYTRSGSSEPYTYTEITTADEKAASGITYYRLTDTKVRLTGGKILRDAYGGGLGDASNPAYVWGDVLVDLNGETTVTTGTDGKKVYTGASIDATTAASTTGCIVSRVFGCNNVNGSPKGEVAVYVHATQSADANKTTIDANLRTDRVAEENPSGYDVEAVYGGGNEAEYWPVAVKANVEDETEDNYIHTNVIIDGCDYTSIKQVFGGGNAATTPATNVTIYGAYEINEVFGGGNGESTSTYTNPGAHVGFHHYTEATATTSSDKDSQKYGFGKAQVNIGGGMIHAVYGGSNKYGNVREIAVATLDDQSDCTFTVGEAYGGGKEAEMDGRAVLNLGCIPTGGSVGDVYGGAKATNVNNDVLLNITNGTYNRVYGGNNVSGEVRGTITINVEEKGCTPIIINQLFGGGNRAAYDVNDIPNDANHSSLNFTTETAENYFKNYPKVNVISATRIGQVYGGGDNADVTGNPHVKVEMVPGVLNQGTSSAHTQPLGVIGQVFGGGNNANVNGSTYVDIVKGQITYTQVVKTAATSTTATEYYLPGVYGGCNTQGTITGDAHVNVTGGTIGVGELDLSATPKDYSRETKGNVFGGGYGKDTYVAGNVIVNIGEETATSGVYSGSAIIFGDVYGGGALGHVNVTESTTELFNSNATTTVNLNKGTIYGDAYGGGLGVLNTTPAHVGGDIGVNQNGVAFIIGYEDTDEQDPNYPTDPTKKIKVVNSGRIFGSNNLCGSPNGDITVTVNKTVEGNIPRTTPATSRNHEASADATTYELAAVYGGGNLAPYTATGKKTHVIVNGCSETSIQTVYGGGNAAEVPEAAVDINSAYEIGYVFGGGNGKDKYYNGSQWVANPGANVMGNTTTWLRGGVIHEAYGASNEKGTITGTIFIDMSDSSNGCDLKVGKLVGAGKNADVEQDIIMIMGCKPETKTPLVYGGADNANVKGNVELTVTSGNFGQVFGGNNLGGAIMGHIKLNIEETGTCATPIRIDQLYLGGNRAAYSRYGYYVVTTDGTGNPGSTPVLKNDRLDLRPRESANDERKPVKKTYSYNETDGKWEWEVYSGTGTDVFEPYDEPVLNIISCTSIGEVFGGGYGVGGDMYANPTVNINMIPGSHAADIDSDNDGNKDNDATNLGTIGDVFGGGDAAAVYGDVTVNIGTATTVELTSVSDDPSTTDVDEQHPTVLGANITGSVYGGGKLADVGKTHLGTDTDNNVIDVIDMTGNTFVNIGALRGAEILDANGGYNYSVVDLKTTAGDDYKGITIGGDVFGGGQGEAISNNAAENSFRCGKAMVTGSTNVCIGNGTVNGTVYGGGKVGRVEDNTRVTIGLGEGFATVASATSTPDIKGDVFGAGKGVKTHGYSALVRGHSYVNVAGNAKVRKSVYGGGEIASVGRYNVAKVDNEVPGIEKGMPYSLKNQGSGYCYVTVQGYAEIGPDKLQMKNDTGGPDDTGYVFGGGKGILPYDDYTAEETPWREDPTNKPELYAPAQEDKYLKFIETLALSTQTYVTIDGYAFVKGSVYGGSENGHVQHDTDVKIKGHCQIGNGWNPTLNSDAGGNVNARYNEDLFINPVTATAAEIETSAASMYECASWEYKSPFKPYDKYEDTADGSTTATDGHTFFGNVFGGGSGLYPYKSRKPEKYGKYEWLRSAGRVYGNTNVEITGGHILTSVYGGCELTDVGNGISIEADKGTCKVKMSGGTIGVPRTLAQIAAHPVTCYLFGAGKGDQRTRFNQWTNVGNVIVEVNDSISQPIIYGSVLGGGEDGHVLGNVYMNIKKMNDKDPVIGTWGTSYVDGNVFGGGRGFSGEALTAGVVSGNVDVRIQGGAILGSVYGGGRLASVGTYLVPENHAKYGKLITDGEQVTVDEANGTVTTVATGGGNHGHITIDISGGTIGNRWEYDIVPNTVNTETAFNTWKAGKPYIPNTEFELVKDTDNKDVYRLAHTKGGNVFVGSMGRLYALDGITALSHWPDLGKAKSTKLTIRDNAVIKSNVYGGGELGVVEGSHKDANNKDVSSEIIITGGTIGTEVKDASDKLMYSFGSVFGGGYGSDKETLTDGQENEATPKLDAGKIYGNTKVAMSGAETKVLASVYGGGEVASVTGSTDVSVTGGEIGTPGMGGVTMGNVYGGGKGKRDIVRAGRIMGDTKVDISGSPKIYHNIYGGGAYGTVGLFEYEYTTHADGFEDIKKVCDVKSHTSGGDVIVNITGGTIGIDGHENGMVFGSSRGDVGAPGTRDDFLAWTYDTHVTIGTSGQGTTLTTPLIKGSVYGSGENGHTYNDTEVIVHSGTIGITDTSIDGGAAYAYRGNVYGGGCGTDMYDSDDNGTEDSYNALAGVVYGDTRVTIDGGQVVHNVYGAGAMGSVGLTNTSGAIIKDGTTTITINGGKIGVDGTKGDGNVYGAARGDFDSEQTHLAQVSSTSVSMNDGTVYGNVYGGGEAGDVGTYVKSTDGKTYTWDKISEKEIGACAVEITGGTVKGHVFGAGKGKANTFECEKAMVRTATVSISDGTVEKNVYGGGEVGRVDQDSKVTIGVKDQAKGSAAPTVKGNVFGAGAGKDTHGYSALVRGNTDVVVQGNAKVEKSVYGGGEIAAVGRYGLDSSGMPSTLVSGGECKVTVKGYADIEGNVFGAGEGVDESKKTYTYTTGNTSTMPKRMMTYDPDVYKEGYENPYEIIGTTGYVWEYYPERSKYLKFLQTLALATDTKLSIEGNAIIKGSVYGGSESGFVQRDTEVKILGETGTDGSIIDGNIYGGGKGLATFAEAGRVNGGVTIDVSGSTTRGSVYGGGELGIVVGDVKVDINNGTVEKDVYGGGALADTQTGNWDTSTNTWAEGKIDTDGKTAYKTIVNLMGGLINGDAYGGGLGDLASRGTGHSDVAAQVYGDVFVTLGNATEDVAAATATTFRTTYATDDKGLDVVNSGRVFGCNNFNGSPMGNVTVTVNRTVKGKDADGNNLVRTELTRDAKNKVTSAATPHVYEVAAVYGGGNLANYEPAADKKPMVRLTTCDISIEEVYGGGNAAMVPETDVLILGAHEIEHVFGGGNGEDKYTLNGTDWITNPGANVGTAVNSGNTNTLIRGGYVHEAYGASNSKGTIFGDVMIDTGTTDADHAACPVQVEKLVAAGKDADVNGDLKVILGCKDAIKIPIVYGGADNANVNGNVELTITSGHFGQVFGGNNLGGAIRGHIILNIEETSDCEPIRIDELYLGGNQAAYSKFGYYIKTTTSEGENATGKGAPGEEAVPTASGKLWFMPRKSKDDPHYPVNTYDHETKTWTVITDKNNYPEYDDPVMNLISCTEAKEVFGGGFGDGGDMYANPTVNINMIPGYHADKIKRNGTANTHDLGTVGDVYGGGNLAAVLGAATINIGTTNEVTVNSMTYNPTTKVYTAGTATVEGAYITGNVYGGGKLADVTGNTYVNICAKEADDASTADVIEYKGVTISGTDYEGVTIAGNVFGGGKGIADSFTCAKAMIGIDKENDGKTDITKESTNKGTRVSIGNGTVNGTVYGGGEIGRVEWNTVVTIGLPVESGTSAPVIRGDVFGAGKGVEPYGYAALVRGNTFVTVQADAKVGENVFGGGEIASVGKYTIASAEYAASHPEIEEGMPYSLANQGSGYCNVIIRGNAEIGPDGMVMNNTTTGKPDDSGHVFGAGKGVLPYENLATIECQTHPGEHHPGRMAPGNVWECYDGNEAKYLSFVETQALATQTDVTIDGNAFVKGSVYGGSENGHVQHDTHVTIAGGQIGAGEGINERYTDHYGAWPTETESIETSWKECAHWEYTPNDAAPWDPYAIYESEGKYYYDAAHTQYAEGGAKVGKDGHTFYGNVFGGGSGLLPYAPGKWHRASGSVGGNTLVDITGGHILTSVYGGNEQTDVGTYKKDSKGALVIPVSGGKCTINMTGGTLGVPRTAADAKAHPVTCYLFGAGKGDQRIFFNTWTNVINTEVNISGTARIYGSTFGGGEDGHVIDNAETNISGTAIIGTTGTSYVDGNVFGGGRGFSGDAQTAGTIGGNIEVNINGGTMLGNIYGGGRLASVGTQFTAPTDPNYGNFIEDETGSDAKTYGHVTVNISGGTIGNNGTDRNVIGDVSGNVFGGSMGRLTLLNGETNPIWPKMAQVKATKVTVSGGTIKHNVYGGGELGTVRDNAIVNISGGQVNRDVYGAGYGSDQLTPRTTIEVKEPKPGVTNPTSAADYNVNYYTFTPMLWAGCVGKSTTVNISGGLVRKSVYGGGEMASVGIIDSSSDKDGNLTHSVMHTDEKDGFALSWPYEFKYTPGYEGATHVNVTGGRIGVTKNDDDINTDNGDVYGGGKGIAGDYKDYVYCANVGSSEVTINYTSSATTEDPTKYLDGGDCITGAVYGGAENGHVMGDTKLTLVKGLVGHSIYGGGSGKGQFTKTLDKITGVEVVTNNTPTPAATKPNQTTDKYDATIYSITAGKVFGNTEIEMTGGYVVRNVYGGGNLGSVGKGNYAGGADDYSTAGYGEKLIGNLWDGVSDNSKAFLNSGKSTVTITGGTVGYIDFTKVSDYTYSGLPYGNVFGGCRGESAPNIGESPRYLYCPTFFSGYANETEVTIGNAGGTGPTIWGSVYGGGMDGHVRRDAKVTINGGEIGRPYTGDGSAADLAKVEWSQCGNVYGAGSGIGQYKYDFNYDGDYEDVVKYTNPQNNRTTEVKERDFSTSAGSVTRFTTVIVNGGKIHRNVYGGGSLSSIGGPKIPPITYDPYRKGDTTTGHGAGKQSQNEVTIAGGTIGDEAGFTKGYGGCVFGASRGDETLANPTSFASSVWTDVNIQGGTIVGEVYGGGEAGTVRQSTDVQLTGGMIVRDAFAGGKGTSKVAADVGGDATIELNRQVADDASNAAKMGAVVKGNVFGANNVNGTPKGHVLVHVYGTQNENTTAINAKVDGKYDVTGVYGGGKSSDYVPDANDTKQSTEVIIEGCDLTSIYEVYGGGYGAATPATDVLIKGTKIIENVFGGGYGASTAGFTNPGANIGYHTDKSKYDLGTGKALVRLMAGTIKNVYGASNTLGDIRGGSNVTNVANDGSAGCCDKLTVGEIYGGGKQADMYGGAEIILGCMPNDWIGAIYAGAENADIGGDVGLTLTSGKFERVFGGNNKGGKIDGYIEVNIEENPNCETPIIIGELYGGGNEAQYEVPKTYVDNWKTKYGSNADYPSPRVNVRAFTSIGNIYGGGLGEGALVTGNPLVNINEVAGGREYAGETRTLDDGTKVTLYDRKADGKMGVIGNVFGGGNAAPVKGNTYVSIGTEAYERLANIVVGETDVDNYYTRSDSKPYVFTKASGKAAANTVYYMPVQGADIRGNVYGGGNNAAVTGDPKVVIGQKKTE